MTVTPDTVEVVRVDLLDLALVVIAAAFAISGYRQGFIVGSLSFVGFVGGAVLGAQFGPAISRAIVGGQTQQDVVAVIVCRIAVPTEDATNCPMIAPLTSMTTATTSC